MARDRLAASSSAVVFMALFAVVPTHAFTPGAICDPNTSSIRPGDNMRVVEVAGFPQFASEGPPATGLNIELIAYVAQMLNVSYTLSWDTRRDYENNWTATLIRLASENDLVMSYWDRTAERLLYPELLMMTGQYDTSAVLVARVIKNAEAEEEWWTSVKLWVRARRSEAACARASMPAGHAHVQCVRARVSRSFARLAG